MKIRFLLTAAALATALPAIGADPIALETTKQRFSYAVGARIGMRIQQDGLDVDSAAMAQAIRDVLESGKLRLSEEDMRAASEAYQQDQIQQRLALGNKNKSAADAYLAENKKKAGVVETASGLQYKIVKAGSGKKPKATDTVVVNYRGKLIDGTEFDSSYSRGQPATFKVNGLIKGWEEALQLMSEGAQWQVVVPPALGYGEQGAGRAIGPNAVLVFDLELISIE